MPGRSHPAFDDTFGRIFAAAYPGDIFTDLAPVAALVAQNIKGLHFCRMVSGDRGSLLRPIKRRSAILNSFDVCQFKYTRFERVDRYDAIRAEPVVHLGKTRHRRLGRSGACKANNQQQNGKNLLWKDA